MRKCKQIATLAEDSDPDRPDRGNDRSLIRTYYKFKIKQNKIWEKDSTNQKVSKANMYYQ